jgi:hypothetical protein
MFIVKNRHGEILTADGEFYPPESVEKHYGPKKFETREQAKQYALRFREYIRIIDLDAE